MSALIPFMVLDQTCDQVLTWINQQLISAGFRVVKTFDFQVARLAHPDYPCQHHGSGRCTCQMVVLLVYGKQEDPSTLVVHGQDKRAWVSITGTLGKQFNQQLEILIQRALIPYLSSMPPSTEMNHDTRSTV